MERWNRAVSDVNLSAQFLGMNKLEVGAFALRRTLLGRKRMTQFLEHKVKALTSHMPSIISDLASGNDLAMVVASSALLDEYLGLIIVIRFHVTITEKNWNRAFTNEGPLARFASKISMGILLGLVIGEMINDMAHLKRIRNDFAHSIDHQSLSLEPHAKHCRKLKMKIGLSDKVRARCASDESRQYLESVAANIMYLSAVLNRALAEKSFVVENVSEINARARESADKVQMNSNSDAATSPP